MLSIASRIRACRASGCSGLIISWIVLTLSTLTGIIFLPSLLFDNKVHAIEIGKFVAGIWALNTKGLRSFLSIFRAISEFGIFPNPGVSGCPIYFDFFWAQTPIFNFQSEIPYFSEIARLLLDRNLQSKHTFICTWKNFSIFHLLWKKKYSVLFALSLGVCFVGASRVSESLILYFWIYLKAAEEIVKPCVHAR